MDPQRYGQNDLITSSIIYMKTETHNTIIVDLVITKKFHLQYYLVVEKKRKVRENVQKLKPGLCIRGLFFLRSSPINQLMTPKIYLVTLWSDHIRLATTELN